MTTAYIGVGSNLGDRFRYLCDAQELFCDGDQVRLLRESSIYETEPVGGPAQGEFLNAVWKIQTSLTPEELLSRIRSVEKKLGRERREVNEPRTIDLDILFYGDQILKTGDLEIPHPRLHERYFVLKPLAEISPELRHPKFHLSAQKMLEKILETSQKH